VAPTNLATLSEFLGFAPQHLFYVIELADRMYFEFEIDKADGGKRKIAAPRTELKGIQRAILSKVLEKIPFSDYCYAYVPGRSAIEAATRISGHKAVLHLDISDFFPTITRRRVFGLFASRGFNTSVSFMLAKLCTYRNHLCQGAPTSPCISNLIFYRADQQLRSLANTFKLEYIRYSDDIFIFAEQNFRYKRVAEIASKILKENGFKLNAAKTKYHRRNAPRYTLGLQTVGPTPRLARSSRRLYRSAFFKASRNLKWGQENESRLLGMASWYKAVHGNNQTYKDFIRILKNVQGIKFHEPYVLS
jgi:RNA-directed DNA polymerase